MHRRRRGIQRGVPADVRGSVKEVTDLNFELSKDIGIALKIGEKYAVLRRGVRKIRKISEPYTMSTFFVGNDFAKTEVLGVRKFLRINGSSVPDDEANGYICGLYGKTGDDCCTEAVLFDRKTFVDGVCEGLLVPVAVVMKNSQSESAPEDGTFVEFECDIYINGNGTSGNYEIAEV